jgi:hypothetical protein
MDKSQKPPSRHGDYPLGAKGTTAKPTTPKKVVKSLTKDFEKAFAKEKGVAEGWSDAMVSRRTGTPRTPYSVFIKGKKWKDFENDDHAEAVANKLRAKFRAEGRDPSVITVAPTDMSEAISKKDLLNKVTKDLNSDKFKNTSIDPKYKGWTGAGKDDYGYTGYQGHGMPTDKQERELTRKKKGVAEARPVTASADITASAKKLWQYIGRNLEDLASNADFDAERNELYINDRLNNLFTTPNGQPVKVAFDMSPDVDFDKGILYIPIGTIWKYRGMYTAERFVNDVIQALGKPGVAEEKTRLDPKCWTGKKIGSPKTKVKGGVRVNNCVPAESVNEDQDTSGVEQAILKRIMVAHLDLLRQYGPEKVMQAAEEVAYNVGDLDEIGTSDVSGWVKQVQQILGAVQEATNDTQ